jgi:hypothetical protein
MGFIDIYIHIHVGELLNLPGSNLFHDWYPQSQPDNGKSKANQHCVVVFGDGDYKWNDVQCTFAREFISLNCIYHTLISRHICIK